MDGNVIILIGRLVERLATELAAALSERPATEPTEAMHDTSADDGSDSTLTDGGRTPTKHSR